VATLQVAKGRQVRKLFALRKAPSDLTKQKTLSTPCITLNERCPTARKRKRINGKGPDMEIP
jgi:hypothetical protein